MPTLTDEETKPKEEAAKAEQEEPAPAEKQDAKAPEEKPAASAPEASKPAPANQPPQSVVHPPVIPNQMLQHQYYPPPGIIMGRTLPPPTTTNADGNPKKQKRQYIIKNPNRPKRPLSAYNIFFKHERERLVRAAMMEEEDADKEKIEEIIAIRDRTKSGKRVHRKTHGAIAFADLGKQIAKNWKALSEEERAKFDAEAAIDKERYQRELEEANAKLSQQPAKQPDGPRIRNKRLGNEPAYIGGVVDKRHKTAPYELQPSERYSNDQHQYPGPGPRGPPPYYDPYFGYGRPSNAGPGPNGEGYGPPPPPGYGGPPPPPGPYGYYPPPPPDYQYHYSYPPYQPRQPGPMQPPNQDEPNSPPRWMPPDGVENQPPPPVAECHYQCEVCNRAVFSTFKECAEHEEECAKSNATGKENNEDATARNDEGKPPQPSPNTQKKDEKEQRDAVEAVLRLKTGSEGVDV